MSLADTCGTHEGGEESEDEETSLAADTFAFDIATETTTRGRTVMKTSSVPSGTKSTDR